jgi:hypothetical protein
MNPMIMGSAASLDFVLGKLDELTHHPRHSFWDQSMPVAEGLRAAHLKVTGYRQTTDAYLLALAIHHKGKFVTLDRRVLALAPKGSKARDSLVIVE